jgi:methyl-accepting chemotaxis protein
MKNNYRINLILAVLFFASVAVSAYILFRIPYALRVPSGASGFLTTLYTILAVTFVLGGVAIVRAFQYKEELIVYRERTREMKQADEDAAEKKNEISLDSVKSALKESRDNEDIIQNGLNALCKQLGAGQGAFYWK